jgi:hypothetical protein
MEEQDTATHEKWFAHHNTRGNVVGVFQKCRSVLYEPCGAGVWKLQSYTAPALEIGNSDVYSPVSGFLKFKIIRMKHVF